LASVALIAIGIVACVSTLGKLQRNEARNLEAEQMQRLALRKYDEIAALGILPSGQASGDFLDVGERRFIWQASRIPTGTGNLDSIRVDVARKGESFQLGCQIEGLLCRPATKTQSANGAGGQS